MLRPYTSVTELQKQMRKLSTANRTLTLALAISLLTANILISIAPVSAATLTNSYIRLARMQAATGGSSTNDIRVVFKTISAGATGFTVNFNGADSSTWTGNSGAVATSGMTVTAVSGCDVGATAASGSPSVSGSGSTLTVTSITALSAATVYCFDITKASTGVVTTPTAGEYHPVITETGGATDSTTVAVRVVSSDQVVVNAVVPPTFNFAISGCSSNIDNFSANLSSGSVGTTSGCTVTVNTNAKNGWLAWAKDANGGLASTAASKTITSTTPGTNATLSAGTEGYVLGVTSITNGGGGTATATNAYGDGAGGVAGAAQGSGLDSTLRLIISSNGTASNASFVVKERAAITTITPAANDYTDTITLVGAGYF